MQVQVNCHRWLFVAIIGLILLNLGQCFVMTSSPRKLEFATHQGHARRTAFMENSSGSDDSVSTSTIGSNLEEVKGDNPMPRRTIAKLEKFARLPVWPVWQGVVIFVLSKIFGEEFGAMIEDKIGGRVCPNFFQNVETSPFIMLVHHRHSFAPWDLLRYPIKNLILPEGFPAHPHRKVI